MPHLDGLGVLEKVGNTELEKIPIFIMLSAVGQDKITQRAINLGAQYYVVKPFDIELLVKRIRDVNLIKVYLQEVILYLVNQDLQHRD